MWKGVKTPTGSPPLAKNLAKNSIRNNNVISHDASLAAGEPWRPSVGRFVIYGVFDKQLDELHFKYRMKEFWTSKFNIQRYENHVMWELFYKSIMKKQQWKIFEFTENIFSITSKKL